MHNGGKIIVESNAFLYTGHPIQPKYTLNIGGRELNIGTDFDVEITDNVNVGTAHVTIRGKGKFKGVLERTFEIKPVPAQSLSFLADQTEFDYTGEPCTMQIAVKYGDIVLTEGEDYTVEYTNNIEPGTGQAELHFQGNYSGTMTIPFSIFRPQEPPKPPVPSKPAAEEIPALENLSVLSSDTIRLGETIQASAQAQGGVPPYTYGFYFRKIKANTWITVQDYGEEAQATISPARATRYLVLVKVKDSRGVIAKQYFKVSVTGEKTADEKD